MTIADGAGARVGFRVRRLFMNVVEVEDLARSSSRGGLCGSSLRTQGHNEMALVPADFASLIQALAPSRIEINGIDQPGPFLGSAVIDPIRRNAFRDRLLVTLGELVF